MPAGFAILAVVFLSGCIVPVPVGPPMDPGPTLESMAKELAAKIRARTEADAWDPQLERRGGVPLLAVGEARFPTTVSAYTYQIEELADHLDTLAGLLEADGCVALFPREDAWQVRGCLSLSMTRSGRWSGWFTATLSEYFPRGNPRVRPVDSVKDR